MKMTGHVMYGDYNKKDPFNRHIRLIFYLSNGKTMDVGVDTHGEILRDVKIEASVPPSASDVRIAVEHQSRSAPGELERRACFAGASGPPSHRVPADQSSFRRLGVRGTRRPASHGRH